MLKAMVKFIEKYYDERKAIEQSGCDQATLIVAKLEQHDELVNLL